MVLALTGLITCHIIEHKMALCIGPYLVYFFTVDWEPLVQKPTGSTLKFLRIKK